MTRYSSLTDRLAGLGGERWAVHEKAVARRAAGDEIVMLSIGEPDTPTPAPIVEAAATSMRQGRTRYSASRGEPSFLDAVARRYSSTAGCPISTDQVLFMPGTHTALYAVCQAVLDEGDELLLPEPYYAAYGAIFAATGADIVSVALQPDEGFHLQMEALERALTDSSRALILNNPHNPTGAVLAPARVREIVEFCAANDIWLISDEVYEDLVYDGVFVSPLSFDEFHHCVVVVSSVSKSHAMTGWRCGWAVGPEELIERTRRVSEAMMFGAQPFLQDATVVALEGEFEECASMYADYRRRAGIVVDALSETGGLHANPPQGGIFVMVDVRDLGLTGVEFAHRLLDEWGVATMPGESFGRSGSGHIRISLTTDDESIVRGCKKIRAFAESLD